MVPPLSVCSGPESNQRAIPVDKVALPLSYPSKSRVSRRVRGAVFPCCPSDLIPTGSIEPSNSYSFASSLRGVQARVRSLTVASRYRRSTRIPTGRSVGRSTVRCQRSFPGQDSRHSSRAIGQDSRLTWMAFERRCIRRARCKQSAVQPFAGPLKVVLLTPARRTSKSRDPFFVSSAIPPSSPGSIPRMFTTHPRR